jgi:hypothetical protein
MKIVSAIFKTFLLSLLIAAQVNLVRAQDARIIPPAETTFFDQNGKPLTSGTVDYFVPSSTTRKNTWKDFAKTVLNTNPVVLDGAGRSIVLGVGSYRQIVKDRNGNIIWDQVTAAGGGGSDQPIQTGDGDLVATIKPWAGMIAPNQYLFAYGQELNRTTYAALFTAITTTATIFCTSGSPILTGFTDTTNFPVGANVEVSCLVAGTSTIVSKTPSTVTLAANAVISTNVAATVFPWGNGNHSTTFNIPDLRGYVLAANDNMGGAAAGVLTTPNYGTNPDSVNAAGGSQTLSSSTVTINTANLPPYTPTGTLSTVVVTDPGHAHSIPNFTTFVTPTGFPGVTSGGVAASLDVTTGATNTLGTGITVNTPVFTGVAQGGTSTPLTISGGSIIQPTKTTNYIVKVTPDQNSAIASGVTSLGLMTGDVACGAGLLCTGNIIQVTSVPVSGIVVGSTTVSGGSNTNVLYNNAGILGEYQLATFADMYAGTSASKLVTPSVVWPPEVTVTYGTTTTFDMSTFRDAVVTLTGNITTQTLSNVVVGKSGSITFIQDGAGLHTTVWDSKFKFAGGVAPVLTTTAGAVDVLNYQCRTSTFCFAAMMNDVK